MTPLLYSWNTLLSASIAIDTGPLFSASIRPPWQPWFPSAFEQSTSCCSEMDTSLPVAISHAPSSEPVAEKLQHEPHWPWFFTGVTAPLVVQSTESASSAPEYSWRPRYAAP